MNKQIGRKRYSKEFKLEAVRLANEPGHTKTQIAGESDLSRAMLYTWCDTVRSHGKSAFKANKGDANSESQELKRLRIENKQLREDREILKKAATYFARELK